MSDYGHKVGFSFMHSHVCLSREVVIHFPLANNNYGLSLYSFYYFAGSLCRGTGTASSCQTYVPHSIGGRGGQLVRCWHWRRALECQLRRRARRGGVGIVTDVNSKIALRKLKQGNKTHNYLLFYTNILFYFNIMWYFFTLKWYFVLLSTVKVAKFRPNNLRFTY